jgi:hypothetical protein
MTTDTVADTARVELPDLRNDTVTVKPQDFDFSSENWSEDAGYSERSGVWSTVTPEIEDWTASDCYGWISDRGVSPPDFSSAIDAEEVAETWRQAVTDAIEEDPDAFAPMMNYVYPLPGMQYDSGTAQALLMEAGGACVIVDIDGEPFLALSGGGMDLSWDICAAYVALGMLPPAHFAGNLPNLGGMQYSGQTAITLEACARSLELLTLWTAGQVERLDQRRDELIAYTAETAPAGGHDYIVSDRAPDLA